MLQRSRASAPNLVVQVLRSEGGRLHWTEIAERVNRRRRRLGMSRIADQTVHNVLSEDDNRFSYADSGTHGLKEWGDDVPYVRELIKEALEASGMPMTRSQIQMAVSKMRVGKGSSVAMYLDLHQDFYLARSGKQGLREWLVERPTLRTPRDFVEEPKSQRRIQSTANSSREKI